MSDLHQMRGRVGRSNKRLSVNSSHRRLVRWQMRRVNDSKL
jgi:RecG-like helicase